MADGLTPEEVEQTMKFVANEHDMSNVGAMPLSNDMAAKSGEAYRFAKIYLFCNSWTAARMPDYTNSFGVSTLSDHLLGG